MDNISPAAGVSPAEHEDFAGVIAAEDLEPLSSALSPELTGSDPEAPAPFEGFAGGTDTVAPEAPASSVPAAPAASPVFPGLPAQSPVPAAPEASVPSRDYTAEVRELLDARPELIGQSLPPEVIRDCVESGRSLLSVYTENETRVLKARLDELTRENSILRMNAEAAERAPVRSASLMGSPEAGETDPFLIGFND